SENSKACDLRPIGEGRFIETQLIVDMRDDVIAPLNHFPRCFSETRLVAVDQRNAPRSKDVKENASEKQQNVIASCRFHRRSQNSVQKILCEARACYLLAHRHCYRGRDHCRGILFRWRGSRLRRAASESK